MEEHTLSACITPSWTVNRATSWEIHETQSLSSVYWLAYRFKYPLSVTISFILELQGYCIHGCDDPTIGSSIIQPCNHPTVDPDSISLPLLHFWVCCLRHWNPWTSFVNTNRHMISGGKWKNENENQSNPEWKMWFHSGFEKNIIFRPLFFHTFWRYLLFNLSKWVPIMAIETWYFCSPKINCYSIPDLTCQLSFLFCLTSWVTSCDSQKQP